jgi:hypothetical protein
LIFLMILQLKYLLNLFIFASFQVHTNLSDQMGLLQQFRRYFRFDFGLGC